MAEKKTGIHSIISTPFIYNLVQFVAGAKLYRERMITNYIRPFDGCRILDIGCGTGEYVDHIKNHCKNFEYYGFDGEESYILSGQERYKNEPNVHLYHKLITEEVVKDFNDFDIVIATGVMHHLDDALVVSLLKLAKLALKKNGRLITYDPGKYDDITFIENFFVKNDRGRSIRFEKEYAALIGQVFSNYKAETPSLTYFPVRNIVFECIND